MLQIIVLGSGLIPRGHGIAPCYEPFETDKDTIKLIMDTKGMAPYAVSRRDGHKVRLTYSNFDRILRMSDFNGDKPVVEQQEKKDVTQLSPVTPKPKFDPVVITKEPVVEEKSTEEPSKTEETKAEPAAETQTEEKPEEQQADSNNYSNNYYGKKKDKHNNSGNQGNTFKPVNNPNSD